MAARAADERRPARRTDSRGRIVGTLRIVAGHLKGRRIHVPDDPTVRPTGERVREALFNILGQDLGGFQVLDLFAGTGALGFEAISRGARRVVFVESSPKIAATLRRTAEQLGVAQEARVVVGRVEELLERRSLGGPFEVILADPPYEAGPGAGLVPAIDEGRLLGLHGVLVVERESRHPAATGSPGLRLSRTAAYGRASLDFYRY